MFRKSNCKTRKQYAILKNNYQRDIKIFFFLNF